MVRPPSINLEPATASLTCPGPSIPPRIQGRLFPLKDDATSPVPVIQSVSLSSSVGVPVSPRPPMFLLKIPGQPDRRVTLVKAPKPSNQPALLANNKTPDDEIELFCSRPAPFTNPSVPTNPSPPPSKQTFPSKKVNWPCTQSQTPHSAELWRRFSSKNLKPFRSGSNYSKLPLIPERGPDIRDQDWDRDSARWARRLKRSGGEANALGLVEKETLDPLITEEVLLQAAMKLFPVGPSLRHAKVNGNWYDFRTLNGISPRVRPMWEDYQAFFRLKRDQGMALRKMKSLYRELRRIHEYVYLENLRDWDLVYTDIKNHDLNKKPICSKCVKKPNGHLFKIKCKCSARKKRKSSERSKESKKKELVENPNESLTKCRKRKIKRLKLREVEKFLKNAPSRRKSLLLCKAVSVVYLCGGCKIKELKFINRRDVVVDEKGYQITMQVNDVTQKFLVPREKAGSTEVCFAKILDKYLDDLDLNVDTGNHACLFMARRKVNIDNKPKIVGYPMGPKLLVRVGRTVATWLKLPEPRDFNVVSCLSRARSEFVSKCGDKIRICQRVTPHDPIVEPKNETRERLSIESNFVIADQNSMSGQIIYTKLLDFDEADPLNLNSVKSNPTLLEHNDSISISSINESNEMRIMETDSETTSSSDTGLFITEGLIFESIPDVKPMELSTSLELPISEDPLGLIVDANQN